MGRPSLSQLGGVPMSKKRFKYLIFIGRFQPVHNGHIKVILEALKLSERLIIICGSAHKPRTIKNPWTVTERWNMIRLALSEHLKKDDLDRIMFSYSYDQWYNDNAWVTEIQKTVKTLSTVEDSDIGIIGFHKDESSYYLNLFPQWSLIKFKAGERIINSTDIRNDYFSHKLGISIEYENDISKPVREYMGDFRKTEVFKDLNDEFIVNENYDPSRYPIFMCTTDAVVIQSGHILMIQRKMAPGKGNWALPGGFINYREKIIDSMVRELREETKLKIPEKVIKGSITDSHVFDHPYRSSRGRIITHAFFVELEPPQDLSLPKVKGGDDAARAKWFKLSDIDLMRDKIFEDHADIIKYFISR